MNKDVKKFLDIYNEDIPTLVKNGIKEDDIPILLDKVQYEQENEADI